MFVGVTPAGGAQPSTTGCRTPPEWPLGGVFHAALQIGSWFRKPLGSEPRQLASANGLCSAPPGRSKARSNRMALTTSRRSRMPTSLVVRELGLGGAHRVQNCREFILHNALALYARFPGRIERAATLSVSTHDLPFSEEPWGGQRRDVAPRLRVFPGMPIHAWAHFALPTLTRWNLKPSSRLNLCRGSSGAQQAQRGTVMWQKIGYCRQKASECAARAQEATDKETRELFLRFRDSWLSAARRYESSAAAAAGETTERPPSSSAPAPSARDWRESPNDARTDTTAERLGAG